MGNIKIVRGVFDTKLEFEQAGVAEAFLLLLTITGRKRMVNRIKASLS